jgi:hypothetical protein
MLLPHYHYPYYSGRDQHSVRQQNQHSYTYYYYYSDDDVPLSPKNGTLSPITHRAELMGTSNLLSTLVLLLDLLAGEPLRTPREQKERTLLRFSDRTTKLIAQQSLLSFSYIIRRPFSHEILLTTFFIINKFKKKSEYN